MPLKGKRILVVEDEMLEAIDIEDSLLGFGAIVLGPATRLGLALDLAQSAQFDVAILDVDLHGGRSYPVAEIMKGRGIPYIFATGYGHTCDAAVAKGVTTLEKPFKASELQHALLSALSQPIHPVP